MIFVVALSVLALAAVLLFNKVSKTAPSLKNSQFDKFQETYLVVFYLATFSDWLQGPYVYKLYSDYGYEEEEIAVLFIAGFASSSLFGAAVGHIADQYGRKSLCIAFGLIYSACCLTKISYNFYVLFFGRILGGISTSILCSTFEAWYINEHVNHYNFSMEWINITFSKAGFFNGLLAILAGILSQISAETLSLGPASPFIIAIPFLLASSYLTAKTWTEHSYSPSSTHYSFVTPLYLILFQDPLLLILGLIQSLFEAVMYTFIFSWTPILSELQPPLGLAFSSFMLAYMIGSQIYSYLMSDRMQPQLVLVLTCGLALVSLGSVSLVISYVLYTDVSTSVRCLLIQFCFLCFILYEVSLGLYFPVIGFLKGRAIPEEYRASIANWFRVPMNIFTCLSLTFNQLGSNSTLVPHKIKVFSKFHLIYILCFVFLIITTSASIVFQRRFTKRFSKAEDSSNVILEGCEEDCPKDDPSPS